MNQIKYSWLFFVFVFSLLFFSCTKELDESQILSVSGDAIILEFSFLKSENDIILDLKGIIDYEDNIITVGISENLENLYITPEIKIPDGAVISPDSGTPQDFSKPVIYKVTAENGNTEQYVVALDELSSKAEIQRFDFLSFDNPEFGESIKGVVDQNSKTVSILTSYGKSINALRPSIKISDKATIIPNTLEVQDFSNPLTYKVIASDGSEQEYVVTIKQPKMSEKDVLIDIYNSSPGNTLNWDLGSEDISGWKGVNVEHGKLIGLSFFNSSVGNLTFPNSVKNLIHLKKITLFGSNNINSFIGLENIQKMNSLEEISLIDMNLTEFPIWITGNANVKEIFLSEGDINELPLEIYDLNNLRSLRMKRNKIKKLSAAIANLKKLKELDLEFNQLSSLPVEIYDMPTLESLNLSQNNLSITLDPSIGDMKEIRYLYLSDNQLTYLPPSLGKLKGLKFLNIRNNQITELPGEICNLIETGTAIYKDETATCP